MALYDAFISYSHAKDKLIAAALQSPCRQFGHGYGSAIKRASVAQKSGLLAVGIGMMR